MEYRIPHGTVYPADLLCQKAREAAQHRRTLREQTRHGTFTLAEIFDQIEQDRTLGRTRIKAVLLWLPTFGTVKVGKILTKASVAPARRLSTLTVGEKARLLADPRIVQHTAAVAYQRAHGGVA